MQWVTNRGVTLSDVTLREVLWDMDGTYPCPHHQYLVEDYEELRESMAKMNAKLDVIYKLLCICAGVILAQCGVMIL